VCLCVCVCVCVCVLLIDLYGGVQRTSPQVSLYKSHTTEESLNRLGLLVDGEIVLSTRYCKTLTDIPCYFVSSGQPKPIMDIIYFPHFCIERHICITFLCHISLV